MILTAAQVAALQPWLARRGVPLADAAVGHVAIRTGPAGPRLDWVDADGLSNEDFLSDGEWREVQRLLRFQTGQNGYESG